MSELQAIEPLEKSIMAIIATTAPEQIKDVLDRLDLMADRIKECRSKLEASMIDWIRENGDLVIGPVRYYVGVKKTTKCINVPEAVTEILTACDGDLEKMCQAFAAQPIKHGYVKTILPEDVYARLFKTSDEDELKEGKPKLQKFDERFTRRPALPRQPEGANQ